LKTLQELSNTANMMAKVGMADARMPGHEIYFKNFTESFYDSR
jgi:hypothetical protein